MRMQISYLLLFLCLMLALTSVMSHGRRNGGRRRWGRRKHGRRGHKGEKGGKGGAVACEFRNSTTIETQPCPGGLTCANPAGGPLVVQADGQAATFKFCNVAYIPQYGDACKVTDLNGATLASPRPCPQGQACEAGPVQGRSRRSHVNMYFCGSTVPTEPVYGHLLSLKACAINGVPFRRCKRWQACDGAKITLPINGASTALTFCKGKEDPGFHYLRLWGKCRGYRCSVVTSKVNPPPGNEGDTKLTP